MCLLKKYLIIVIMCLFQVVTGQSVPSTPCPDVFQYYQQPNGNIYGRIEIPYDGSTTLVLGVNASMRGYYNDKAGIQIKMDTPGLDLIQQRARTLIYSVYFPYQNTIPKITRIKLNGIGYCSGPPEEVIPGSPGVTSLWSEHRYYFQTSNRNNDFYKPSNPIYIVVDDLEEPINPIQRHPEIIKETPSSDRPTSTFESASPSRIDIFESTTPSRIDNIFESPTPSRNQNQECGVPKNTIVPLILGGTDISDGTFPWLAAMFVSKGTIYDYKCTANLVSETHVLTAARCVNYYKVQIVQAEEVLFVFGKVNLKNWATSGAVARGASKIQTHPDFNQISGHGDVSIITLDQRVQFSNTIAPICLWSGNNDFTDVVGKTGTVAGWGADEDAQKGGQFSVSVAKSLEMPIVSNDECLNSNLTYYSLTSDMTFCAGQRDGTGTCVGDNGAAFMMVKKGKYYLRGLASLTLNGSDGKCDLSYFMIFCDVAKFSDWISTSMKE